MELHAVDRALAVRDPLDDAVVAARVDAQRAGERGRIQAQRMIARRRSGDGSPAKTPVPSWSICDVLPCIWRGACITVAPSTSPIACRPRQTPKTGISRSIAARSTAIICGACSGRPGPGPTTSASYVGRARGLEPRIVVEHHVRARRPRDASRCTTL